MYSDIQSKVKTTWFILGNSNSGNMCKKGFFKLVPFFKGLFDKVTFVYFWNFLRETDRGEKKLEGFFLEITLSILVSLIYYI